MSLRFSFIILIFFFFLNLKNNLVFGLKKNMVIKLHLNCHPDFHAKELSG